MPIGVEQDQVGMCVCLLCVVLLGVCVWVGVGVCVVLGVCGCGVCVGVCSCCGCDDTTAVAVPGVHITIMTYSSLFIHSCTHHYYSVVFLYCHSRR